jgi:hypothetical protein
MANRRIIDLTTTQTLCGSDFVVIERLSGSGPATTSNARLSSIYNYVTNQPISATIANNSVTESQITNNSISTSKLKDRSVTTIKIALSAVTGAELASNSVSAVHINDGAVTARKLNSNVVKGNGGIKLDPTGLYLDTPIKTYITNATLVLSDANCIVEGSNSSDMTLTIPVNASVAFPVGTNIVVYQKGLGTVTIAAAAGVTLWSNGNKNKTSSQYAAAALFKLATDTWLIGGDIV